MSKTISKVIILGAGTMGNGIAQWFCQAGSHVQLTDVNHEALVKSYDSILASWNKLKEKGKFTPEQIEAFINCLDYATSAELDPEADLVIEAIVENLEIKQTVFADYDTFFHEKTIFASNTSSIPITLLSEKLSESRKKKMLGLHFFNPATIMKLVEVIKTIHTDETVINSLTTFFKEKEKVTALCKDRPGFIVNRVARNFYGEALRIAKRDHEQTYKHIDSTLKAVGGFRMGPFELMDLIGIDINFSVTKSIWNAFDKEDRFAPHELQEKMVKQGRFGRKTKKGFYNYGN